MIEWRFTPGDVARIRLACSPVFELVLSLIVLRVPARHALHLRWVRWARPRLAGIDLSEVFALVPVRGITADFLSPPPSSPAAELADELALIRSSDPDRIMADVADVAGVPAKIQHRLAEDPRAAAGRLADTLQTYWDLVLQEHWPRMQTLLQADVLWRATRLAEGGAELLFSDLADTIVWHGDRLTAEDSWSYTGSLSGEGLLLMPSVMGWPTVRKMVAPYQPSIIYPTRAVATMWETGAPATPQALAALIGRSRAALLIALDEPASTTTLARRLDLTAGGVSQHLAVLHANGLVTRARAGGSVLYHRTLRGDSLVQD